MDLPKKKILLLGAIAPYCDLVKEFEKLDIIPYISDYYSDAPAKNMGYPSFDVSTMDVDKLIDLVDAESIDGCVSAFSDRNILPCMDVCEHLHSPFFFSREIVDCLTDKLKMKQFFSSIDVPITKYDIISVEQAETALKEFEFPVVTKPIDAYGSKGIFVCQNIDEVKEVYQTVIKESLNYSDKIIVEEFFDGDEISVSAWVKNGSAYITCIYDVFRNHTDEFTLSGVAFPSKYSSKIDELNSLLNYIVGKLNIKEGPVTLQCFIGQKGLKVSELLCRLAGGSPYLYGTYIGGPNTAEMLIQYASQTEIDYQNLCSFVPVLSDDVYYDVQVLINQKGKLRYSIDYGKLQMLIPEAEDIRVYYKNDAELVNVSQSGVQFAKVICKTKRTADYFDLIDRVNAGVEVFNQNGDKISFIRVPDRIDVQSVHDWHC